MAGKKAGRAVAGKRSGPKGPLPLGDTVHRQRPNTCATTSCKRTTDPDHRFHDGEFLWAGRRALRLSSKLTEPQRIKITMTLPRWQSRRAALINPCKMDGRNSEPCA